MLKRLRQRFEENDSQSDAENGSGANGCHHDFEGASSSKTLNEFDPDEDDEDSDDEDDQEEVSELSSWFDRDSMAFLLSVGAHILVVVGLASITIATQPNLLSVFIDSSPIAEELAPLDVVTDIAYSDTPSDEFGADSIGSVDMALSSAPLVADVSAVEATDLDITIPDGDVNVTLTVEKAVGLTEAPKAVRGMTRYHITRGTNGA